MAIAWILIFGNTSEFSAPDAPPTDQKSVAIARAMLRETSELALEEQFWRELLQIGEAQIRAGDFDGALRSIKNSDQPDFGLMYLAETLARTGKKERALEVIRLLAPDWRTDAKETVQLRWSEHLIASGDLKLAANAIEQIKSDAHRRDGLQQLAVAFSKSGDAVQAAKYFRQSIEAAASLKNEDDRARALWEIAEAQRITGAVDAAKATIRRLALEAGDFKDPWAKVAALRESALLFARVKDKKSAQSLFARATECHSAVDALNKFGALEGIAIAQAKAGYVDDALKTAWTIKHSETDFGIDRYRENALYAIAVAQVEAGKTENAVNTALSIKYFVQYRDDALNHVVERYLAQQDFKGALAATDKFDNPSRKASAILKMAAAKARSGNRKAARADAAKIVLKPRSRFVVPSEKKGFDYLRPQSWGVCYESSDAFTIGSHLESVRRGAEVASAAMALAQALGTKPDQSYAVLFQKITTAKIVHSLARTHAAMGDPAEAIAWAKKIGSDAKVDLRNDHPSWAVEQRMQALLGAAEGILDRLQKKERKSRRNSF
jgi:tetratricopeptide (TPR) repeat protein